MKRKHLSNRTPSEDQALTNRLVGPHEEMERGAVPFLRFPPRRPTFYWCSFPSKHRSSGCHEARSDIFFPIEVHCKDTRKSEYMGHCACPSHLHSSSPASSLGWNDRYVQARKPPSSMPQTQLIGQEVGTSPNQANSIAWPATHTQDGLVKNVELDQSDSLLQGFELGNIGNKVVHNWSFSWKVALIKVKSAVGCGRKGGGKHNLRKQKQWVNRSNRR